MIRLSFIKVKALLLEIEKTNNTIVNVLGINLYLTLNCHCLRIQK